MSTQYAFGRIVTSGLVLALDAADRNSYVSGSTVWNDVSGNNYSGSLINGPTFSNNSILFDGLDDYSNHGYISQLYNTKTITYNLWLKWNTTFNNRIIIGNENQTGVVCFGIRESYIQQLSSSREQHESLGLTSLSSLSQLILQNNDPCTSTPTSTASSYAPAPPSSATS
jgi:hypothetical protein